MSHLVHPYDNNSGAYNFFFHPLHFKGVAKPLSIITNVFLTIGTIGLWLIPLTVVNRYDSRKLEVWKGAQDSKTQMISSTILNKQPNKNSKIPNPQVNQQAEIFEINNFTTEQFEQFFRTGDKEKNKERFALLSNEDVASVFTDFDCSGLLSKPQKEYFFEKLKDSPYLWNNMYAKKAILDNFAQTSNDKVVDLINQFPDIIMPLLSNDQEKHYFANLEVDKLERMDIEDIFREQYIGEKNLFALMSEEKVKMLKEKFPGLPSLKDFVSFEIKNLNANTLTKEQFKQFFSTNDKEKNEKRFALFSNEDVVLLLNKFECSDLLSKPQREYFFGNLKADDVKSTYHLSLIFPMQNCQQIKSNFAMVSNEEAIKLFNKFHKKELGMYRPEFHWFSDNQQAYYLNNLEVDELNSEDLNDIDKEESREKKNLFILIPEAKLKRLKEKFPNSYWSRNLT